ncbi:Replicase polyprotein 1ab [Micromonospora sp. NPDC023956]|uniref:Replicase polyprotein 1ab n=1 Tax=Micromonospora sp. NPDC023956 TaxID=3155722 RepID=UPI0033F854C9
MLSLAKPVAETVARHLVATGQLIDEDPAEALAHALAARRLAARISAVREAVGLAAYHAGEWQTAIAELRTYHRMSGLQSHLAVLADCERALGRPERAIDLFRGADQDALDPAMAIELLIVAAGARGDLGQKDAAVAMLQVRELTADQVQPWTARLRYAYADALLAAGRREEAREWFARAAEADPEAETDAAERLLELDGVVLEGDEEEGDEVTADEDAAGAEASEPVRAEGENTRAGAVEPGRDTGAVDSTGAADEAGRTDEDAADDDAAEDDAAEDDVADEDAGRVGEPESARNDRASDTNGPEAVVEAGPAGTESKASEEAPEADRR